MLLKRFVDSRDEVPDPYQHMALVLTNLTRQKSGRQLLLEPGRGTFTALASQLSAPSALRQSGSANAIRNCCFCAEVGRCLPIAALGPSACYAEASASSLCWSSHLHCGAQRMHLHCSSNQFRAPVC